MKNTYTSIKTLLLCALTGLITGCVIAAFNLLINHLANFSYSLLSLSHQNITNLIIYALFMLGLGFFTAFSLKMEPAIGGSGVPRINGLLHKHLNQNGLTVLIYKFFGGIAAIGSGLTLGRGGPSIQIGSTIGQVVSKFFHSDSSISRYLIAGAAGGGMAATFNAPLSGLSFILEGLFYKTSRQLFIYAGIIVLLANQTANSILGNQPSIILLRQAELPDNLLITCLGLGIITGLSGVLFNWIIIQGKGLSQVLAIPQWLKSILPFILTAIILYFDRNLFGSGANLISFPIGANPNPNYLSYLYSMKILLLAFAFCSGMPGGIFFPLLSIGAILGNLYGSLLYNLGLIPSDLIIYLSLFAMSGHFAAIVRAPLSGIFLILEMTGVSLPWLFPITLVTYLSYLVAELLASPPICESLLDLILLNQTHFNHTKKSVPQ
ncbi:ClC family H(+)/Cl(-) exchange transporter [Facklamia sp. P12945]|uniref:ClC family H(+)/Cl(-) exchange transporter n=1 Tax=unclassified Facklamia TaxID=2622293 RepID=UPI003D1680AE